MKLITLSARWLHDPWKAFGSVRKRLCVLHTADNYSPNRGSLYGVLALQKEKPVKVDWIYDSMAQRFFTRNIRFL